MPKLARCVHLGSISNRRFGDLTPGPELETNSSNQELPASQAGPHTQAPAELTGSTRRAIRRRAQGLTAMPIGPSRDPSLGLVAWDTWPTGGCVCGGGCSEILGASLAVHLVHPGLKAVPSNLGPSFSTRGH